MTPRAIVAAVAAAILLASHACAAAPDAAPAGYPAKPVRLIVPFAPGGGTDIIARLIAQELGQGWRQSVIVDNRGGSGGVVGTELAARAAPDGYTMVLVSLGFSYAPALYRKLPYDAGRDFAPVSRVATQPFVFVVVPSLAARSMKELTALAKGKPGELRYGSGGSGGASHLGTELLRVMTGADLVHVPYKGTGPALTAMLAGEIQLQLIGVSSVVAHIKAGRIRALAVSGAKRSAAVPDVPTVAESFPGYAFDVWYGMLYPARVPASIVEMASGDIRRALEAAAVRQRFEAVGLEPEGSTPAEFAALIRSEIARWAKVVQAAGIRVE